MAEESVNSVSGLKAGAAGAGFRAAGDLASGLLSQVFAKRNAALQYKYWQKQVDYMNAYNSPQSQLQRLYDANINPLYNSEFAGNSAASVGNAGAQGAQPPQLGALTSGYNAYIQEKQLELQDRQTKAMEQLNSSQAAKNEAETDNARAAFAGIAADSATELAVRLVDIENKMKDTDLKEETRRNLEAQTAAIGLRLALDARRLILDIDRLQLDSLREKHEYETRKYANATDRMDAQTRQHQVYNGSWFEHENVKNEQQKIKNDFEIGTKAQQNKAEEIKLMAQKQQFDRIDKALDLAVTKFELFGTKLFVNIDPDDFDLALGVVQGMSDVLQDDSTISRLGAPVLEKFSRLVSGMQNFVDSVGSGIADAWNEDMQKQHMRVYGTPNPTFEQSRPK